MIKSLKREIKIYSKKKQKFKSVGKKHFIHLLCEVKQYDKNKFKRMKNHNRKIFFFVPILVPGCSPKKLFSCQLCGKVLCSKASLKRHIADKHAERQEEYRCIICERVYCSRNSLMTHIYTYHKSRPGELEMKDIKYF